MKEIVWKNPNKMVIETGHKTFDAQTNIISDGNIIANTMIGWHIRPHSQTECYGHEFQPGHLRDKDLLMYRKRGIPYNVLAYVRKATKIQPVWLYEFFHYNGERRIVHGYVVTWKDHTLLRKFYTGPTYKSGRIVDECAQYVSN